MSTCFELPEEGAEIHLITHLIVREDQHTLYGFASERERQLFRDLLKVNRVGAKLALGILSGTTVNGFIRCDVGHSSSDVFKCESPNGVTPKNQSVRVWLSTLLITRTQRVNGLEKA